MTEAELAAAASDPTLAAARIQADAAILAARIQAEAALRGVAATLLAGLLAVVGGAYAYLGAGRSVRLAEAQHARMVQAYQRHLQMLARDASAGLDAAALRSRIRLMRLQRPTLDDTERSAAAAAFPALRALRTALAGASWHELRLVIASAEACDLALAAIGRFDAAWDGHVLEERLRNAGLPDVLPGDRAAAEAGILAAGDALRAALRGFQDAMSRPVEPLRPTA